MVRRTGRRERAGSLRRALALEWTLIGYNVLEAAASILFGVWAGSVALIGFGLDSVIEVGSALLLVWRLRAEQRGLAYEAKERTARRLIGWSFLVLAGYVGWEAAGHLVGGVAPAGSLPGVVLAILSLIVMPILGLAQLRIAGRIGSRALRADAMETLVCAYLSFTLLLGLAMNAWLGWWWADPAAALAMLPLLLHEGWEGVQADE